MYFRRVSATALAAAALAIAACSGSGGNASSVIPHKTATTHFYAGSFVSGVLAQYTTPLSSTSAPNFSLTGVGGLFLGANKSNVAVANNVSGICTISIFTQPLTSTSTAAATEAPDVPCELGAFDSSGNLWVAQANSIAEYTTPFSTNQTPALTVTTSVVAPIGVAFDSAQNLYVINSGFSSTSPQLLVFAPPYTSAPIIRALPLGTPAEVVGVAVNGTTVAVGVYGQTAGARPHGGSRTASEAQWPFAGRPGATIGRVSAAAGEVLLYTTPITSASNPTATIPEPSAEAVAFDSSGNLYVGDFATSTGTVDVFNAPLSSSSTIAYSITSGIDNPGGIGFGP